jgi:ParB family transcriptional regulator, chromosome partitioning protein
VTNALRLLRLPVAVQEMLRTGELTAGQARPLVSLDDAAEIERLARQIAQQGLSARQAEALAAPQKRAGGKRRTERPVEPHAAAAAEKLTRLLQTRVEIARRGEGGVVKIHFHSEAELMRLFDVLATRRGSRDAT